MSNRPPEEQPLDEPFWILLGHEEELIREILKRRFGTLFSRVAAALETADPMDVVYPGNPGEYNDVVPEIVVLLARVSGYVSALTTA
jgi:hypothetical protein